MENSESMQVAIKQVAFQAATAVVRAIREADPPAKPHIRKSSPDEPHKDNIDPC